MARKKKETTDLVEQGVDDTLPFEETEQSVPIQSEFDFLTELLRAQEDGNWHGPAAGLIRARLKLLTDG